MMHDPVTLRVKNQKIVDEVKANTAKRIKRLRAELARLESTTTLHVDKL